MTLYEKVQVLCKQKGFSISNLGEQIPGLNITRGSISKWKTGSLPRANTIKAIADYFGVPVEYFTDENYGKVTAEAPASAPEMDDVLMFALLGGTDEKARAMWEKVKEYAEFLKATDK